MIVKEPIAKTTEQADTDQPEDNVDQVQVNFFRRNGRIIVCLVILFVFLITPASLALLKYYKVRYLNPTPAFLVEQLAKYSLLTSGVFWFFFFGGSLGSFLNVIAWRLPRGRTLLGSSYCPGCDTKLKMRDNFPLFGWLWLKGKCRTCDMEIAGRYIIIELLAAMTIGLLAIIELFAAGSNLQSLPGQLTFSVEQFVMSPDQRLVGYFVLHSSLIALLMTAALIKLQQQVIPKSVFAFGFSLYITIAICCPHALPYTETHQEITTVEYPFASVAPMFWGLLISLCGGLVFTRLLMAKPVKENLDLLLLLMLIGTILGWQAAVISITLMALLTFLARLFYKKCSPIHVLWLAASITILTLQIWIAEWQNRLLDGGS